MSRLVQKQHNTKSLNVQITQEWPPRLDWITHKYNLLCHKLPMFRQHSTEIPHARSVCRVPGDRANLVKLVTLGKSQSRAPHQVTNRRFGLKVGQIGPKWDKSGIFSDQNSLHFGSVRESVLKSYLTSHGFIPKVYWNMIWKIPKYVLLGAIWHTFGQYMTPLYTGPC